ncbi:MAG: hypothetical protein HYR90_01270 [Candidatus Andersenbacteria bacterium]|nr:hypothetical protein [Candidatus Andersenbacteria bacterium]MBI3250498.1 hypothetical protein [Candidatus Andersenbacteria bacterium]
MATRESSDVVQKAQVLQALGKLLDLDIHVTVHPEVTESEGESSDDMLRRQRNDFAWFQTFLNTHPERNAALRGNYVAVHNEEIISWGPDEELTRIGSSKKIGIDSFSVLVIPVQVAESEEYWESLQVHLEIGQD